VISRSEDGQLVKLHNFVNHDNAMNVKSDSAKDVTGDFEKFKDFARQILSVPHSEIKAQLDAEKAERRTPKSASRVSGAPAKRS
jgi:hypothetical protein